MSCSFGLIFLQKKLKTWKILIRPSVVGNMKMRHPPTTFRESHQGCCGRILHNLFMMELFIWYAKMDLVHKEAWPWNHANALTIGMLREILLHTLGPCTHFSSQHVAILGIIVKENMEEKIHRLFP